MEGYVESAALGLLAGIFVAARQRGREAPLPPPTTALGALLSHLRNDGGSDFQPMNVNFGLFPALSEVRRVKRREKHERMAERALRDLEPWAADVLAGAR